MPDQSDRWELGRPVYYGLPGENEAYLKDPELNDPEINPPVADWLTYWVDEELMAAKANAEAFYTNYLNPATALPEALDWLAQFCGYTGEYWDASWSVLVKRTLIEQAFTTVWPNKGSRYLLEWLIDLFALDAVIYILGDFRAGITTLPNILGGDTLTFFILVGLSYLRTSPEWRLLEKIRVLYSPIYCESRVCYEQFYANFSVCGDPVF